MEATVYDDDDFMTCNITTDRMGLLGFGYIQEDGVQADRIGALLVLHWSCIGLAFRFVHLVYGHPLYGILQTYTASVHSTRST